MLLRPWLFAAVALALVPSPRAQDGPPLDGPHRPFEDALLDGLTGTWAMRGHVMGDSATAHATAEWVLGHQFLRLSMADAASPPDYEAHVYVGYDHASERYVAHWLDVFGGRSSETLGFGQREGNAVRLVFEYPDGPFHTTFEAAGDGTWRVLMRRRGRSGEWETFAEYALRRAGR